MKHSFWGNGEYPIYINPTFDELVELGATRWDTVRICVNDSDIGMASGYGNSHDSVTNAMRVVLDDRRLLPETYIMFRVGSEFYFNLEDVSGPRQASAKRVIRKYFSDEHGQMLSDLIENTR